MTDATSWTKDLAQLTDSALLAEVAEGLGLVIENAGRLYASATVLADAKRFHGARVLQALSEEEASKDLILLDAVRCPRQPSDRFAAQLGRFNDHLAKGLYARARCPTQSSNSTAIGTFPASGSLSSTERVGPPALDETDQVIADALAGARAC